MPAAKSTRLPPRHPLHQHAEMFGGVAGVDDEMHMVGHQAVCIDLAIVGGLPGGEIGEVIAVVVGVGKDRLAIVTTLDDVVGIVGEGDARCSWHGDSVRGEWTSQ